MLAIRMQRTGRKGHAEFRVIVQDARRSPASGKVVAHLGHYNPHSKLTVIDKEKATFYLEHGAQPSPRVVSILKSEKVKLPEWVQVADKKKGVIRNTDKLRRNRLAEEVASASESPAEEPVEEPVAETTEAPIAEAPVAEQAEASAETAVKNEEKSAEQPTPDEPTATTTSTEPAETT